MKAINKYDFEGKEGKIKVSVDVFALIDALNELSENIEKLRVMK